MAKYTVNKDKSHPEEFEADRFSITKHMVTFYDVENGQVGAVSTSKVLTIHRED